MRTNILLLFLVFTFVSCATPSEHGALTIANGTFVDNKGREVILNGINHVNKNVEQKHIDPNDKAYFTQFRNWGFNVVRFGINWAELEPSPGVINEYYLTQLDERVRWAQELGLWLYFDFHQDLYGTDFGNGAPSWATITDGQAHVSGEIWSDAYILSGAVHHAFDNFWNNTLASDSVGVQHHYLNCLHLIADRYKNSPAVAGYDVMNEPFMGSGSVEVLPFLMRGFAAGINKFGRQRLSVDQIAAAWYGNEQKMELMEMLNNKAIYDEMVNTADSVVNVFEQGVLSDFYQQARDAIRSTGSEQIIFLEHSYFCNLGIASRFKIPVGEDGREDALCCYAAHGYDLVTDSKDNKSQGKGRVEFIFDQIAKSGVRKAT
ncbi:MAG: cellulase family glycosylhydrolase, partial [Mucinivorans sp.]